MISIGDPNKNNRQKGWFLFLTVEKKVNFCNLAYYELCFSATFVLSLFRTNCNCLELDYSYFLAFYLFAIIPLICRKLFPVTDYYNFVTRQQSLNPILN